ncbi:restriction endonuclease subunit S [Alteromonas sp. Cnat3-28]|uniref:restriction endonuclease subunit S n=1 Tax=Alteromonas sp. Cnat3-28 TaxID=2917729 RepID=UPI001EF40B14|nr:restriction endonuclease subunit S [Alteromonas sp. Cnat3-28]MCG7644349.1 restriction endonuclease subunit S [Alteromonas sp. Cnat3-28]
MSADWPVVKLGDLVNEITVGFVGSMTHEYQEEGIPFFRSKNISEYEIDWNDIRYISESFHSKLKKSALAPGDVAIVRTGKPGTTCVIPDDLSTANCSDLVIVRTNRQKLCPHYLSYFMNSVANNQINSHLVGAVQQHFNVGSAKKLEIPLPSREEQDKIVLVLKSLDDKIKVNQKINQSLEVVAQAIFKSWFVDFEPTKAKIAAREALLAENPAATPEQIATAERQAAIQAIAGAGDIIPTEQLQTIAELFPNQLVGSEFGELPDGWSFKTVGELVDVLNGFAFKSKDYIEDGIFVLRTKNFDSNNLVERLSDDVFLPESYTVSHSKYLCEPFDYHLIMVGASVGGRGLILPCQLPAFRNQNMWCFRPKIESKVGKGFTKFMLDSIIDKSRGLASGSAREFFRKGDFQQQRIPVSKIELTEIFEKIAMSNLVLQASNCSQTEVLKDIRDSLLPKLLNGEELVCDDLVS